MQGQCQPGFFATITSKYKKFKQIRLPQEGSGVPNTTLSTFTEWETFLGSRWFAAEIEHIFAERHNNSTVLFFEKQFM